MIALKRVHNPGLTEVVFNVAGGIVGGCSSVEADVTDPVTARLIRLGRLILPGEPAPEPEPEPVPTKAPARRRADKSGD